MAKVTIVDVNPKNIKDYPVKCFMKPDSPAHIAKHKWVMKRFKEGLKVKQIFLNDKLFGFIECIPGESAWRTVDAKGYMFIHCIWIYPNKNKNKGYASKLIKECEKDAKKAGMSGVAVTASEGPFMADRKLFLKNGFKVVDEEESFSLLVKQFKKGTLPKFKDHKKQLAKLKGFQILYSAQCPWVVRCIDECKGIIKKNKIKVTEYKTAKQAQDAPSVYGGIFNLVKDGELLADHYISSRRFENILKKVGSKK
jgi:N-acetylglutamate synthase-like GNAT family acetyltransferase